MAIESRLGSASAAVSSVAFVPPWRDIFSGMANANRGAKTVPGFSAYLLSDFWCQGVAVGMLGFATLGSAGDSLNEREYSMNEIHVCTLARSVIFHLDL